MPIPEFILDLREDVGNGELWMPGVTAVIQREHQILLCQRADNRSWTPITGIVDPGEEPAVAAAREAMEEAGVTIRVDRLARVGPTDRVTYPTGDRAVYLDLTFACTWVCGEAYVADDESIDMGWYAVDELPPMGPHMLARIEAALSGEERARFRT